MFKPDFNLNSKYILKQKKKEDLIKKGNGKTKNVEYYEAYPKVALEKLDLTPSNQYPDSISYRSRSKPRRKSRNPNKGNRSARSRSAATTTKKEKMDIETLKAVKESQKKNS
jgi:hypothetical protein